MSSEVNCQVQLNAWGQYKKLRNKVNNRKKFEESLYKAEKLTEVADCPETLWKTAKFFMGWKSLSSPQQIQVGNEIIVSPRKIAQSINDYFIDKVAAIRSSMVSASLPTNKLREIMRDKDCKMQLKHVSLAKVRKIIRSLSNSKSCGIDELDNFTLKIAADLVAHPIHHIICLSIIQNKFPDNWKYAKVLPLHKKGDESDRRNTGLCPSSLHFQK